MLGRITLKQLLLLVLAYLPVASIQASIIHVPADQLSIQAGIDAAAAGDTVLVAPGVYQEILDFTGKAILLKAEYGPDSTTLTYSSRIDQLVSLVSGEDTLSILDGFTIANVDHYYGVVRIVNSSATIRNCRFINNANEKPGPSSWGVIAYYEGNFLIVDSCYFEGNRSYSAPCIGTTREFARITSSTFIGNEAFGDFGGALSMGGPGGFTAYHNLFVDNRAATYGGAIFISECDSARVENNTFLRNSAPDGGAVFLWVRNFGIDISKNSFVQNQGHAISNLHGAVVSLQCNNYFANAPSDKTGTFPPEGSAVVGDPRFCDTANGEYQLASNSPCVRYNEYCSIPLGALPAACDSIIKTIHVSPLGSDSTGDGSDTNPFRTIQKGIQWSVDGDTVLLADGSYFGGAEILGRSIVVASRFIRDNDSSHIEQTLLDGAGITIPGLQWPRSENEIVGFTISNCDGSGIYVGSGHQVIRYCNVTDNDVGTGAGIYIDRHHGGYPSADILFTEIARNSGEGVHIANPPQSSLISCLIVDNGGTGLTVAQDWLTLRQPESTQPIVLDCKIIGNSGTGIYCGDIPPEIHNSEISSNAGWAVRTTGGEGVPQFYNCLFRGNYGSGLVWTPWGTFDSCLFVDNHSSSAGSALIGGHYRNCTFVQNSFPNAPFIQAISPGSQHEVANCLFVNNEASASASAFGSWDITCTDIFSNSWGDWTGPIAHLADSNGNTSLDPLFCDTAVGDFSIDSLSPGAPWYPLNSCSTLIGALMPACQNVPDFDGDGIHDELDNCIDTYNPDQADSDSDGIGDVCDQCPGFDDILNADSDIWPDSCDNCPSTANDLQENSDTDLVGDSCDNCVLVANQSQEDSDSDGHGDACDNCINTPNPNQADSDIDNRGDACDNCPDDPNFDQADTDGDSVGDVCDICEGFDDAGDTDGDGHPDGCDNCPQDYNGSQQDSDGDLVGDVCDSCVFDEENDIDQDGLCANEDNCPHVANPGQEDQNGDDIGDACCCVGARTGDVDVSYNDPNEVDSSDLGALVNYLFSPPGTGQLPCTNEADVNAEGGPNPVDSSDLGLLVAFLFAQPPGSAVLPECP